MEFGPWQGVSVRLAFVFGAGAACLDSRQTMAARVPRVPANFWSNRVAICLSCVCGTIAAVACWVIITYRDAALSRVVSFDAADPWRGLWVGASVLILLRSKLFNIQDSPIGGEYLYQEGSNAAIRSVHEAWTRTRSSFIGNNLAAVMADPGLEVRLKGFIDQAIRAAPPELVKRVNTDFDTLSRKRPNHAFSDINRDWEEYHRALIGWVLDACGPSALKAMPGISFQ